jgi:homoserine dehydrogenase
MVVDKPGVLASLTTILGQHNISIASVSQKQEDKGSTVPVVILAHKANEYQVKQALEEISDLSIVKGKPVAIRMEKL